MSHLTLLYSVRSIISHPMSKLPTPLPTPSPTPLPTAPPVNPGEPTFSPITIAPTISPIVPPSRNPSQSPVATVNEEPVGNLGMGLFGLDDELDGVGIEVSF